MSDIITERILEGPAICIDHAGTGELVILMHGIGGNRTNWTEQVKKLSSHFHVVAWDARGYGGSDDYDGELNFNDFANDLARVLDHFKVEKAHIGGLSMGGRISQVFYNLYPARVKTLSLIATFTGFDDFSDAEKKKFVDLRLKPLVEGGKEVSDIAPVVARTLVGPHATEAQYNQLVESMSQLHKESYIKTVRSTSSFKQKDEIEQIRVPTLLVFGEDDSLTSPEIGEAMAARIQGCEYTTIPRAGHLINLEQPELFTNRLLEFLLKHQG